MFKGAYTAIVTPFNRDGSIDFGKFRKLVDIQVKAGIDGIVPAGTTGESPTLDVPEHCRMIEESVKAAGKRIKVIAGTGANSTAEALELTQSAIDAGADATLQVTPYYNRPNQEGLYRHFTEIADLGLPVVLYNIPSRTGREISVDTICRLSKHPGIVAVKEAGGSIDRVCEIIARCRMTVLSGDDFITLPMMSVGAAGVISVASNIIPGPVARMVRCTLEGNWNAARRLHLKYYPIFRDLFMDTNPIPVKSALAMMGRIEEVYRLPLCPMSAILKKKLRNRLAELDLV